MTDFRGEDEETPFHDVTIRMTLPASIGGRDLRLQLSNRFGDAPVCIGRGAVTIGSRSVEIAFGGACSTTIPAGASCWSDPVSLAVRHRDEIVVDLYLPGPTPYATANGFRYDRAAKSGDFAGSRRFPTRDIPPALASDGTGWSLPAGGPFLRTIEVAGDRAKAVFVALGASSTVMGWPQYTADLLTAEARIAIVNRGIAGNRLRLDAPPLTPSWGRAGLSRFDEDVLGTSGITHVVVAYNSNDWGLPGRLTPLDEMPTAGQMIESYRELIGRAREAGVQAILATVLPLGPELLREADRESIRRELNDWIRASGHPFVDFDAAIRSVSCPSRLATRYAAPDNTHPNLDGEKRLAQVMVEALARVGL